MRTDEILSVIEAAKNAGSFKLKLVFAVESEISWVRLFLTMLKGGGITVDDETVTKLRLVAITRRWQDDTDRMVAMTMEDDFDQHKFIAKLEFAIESIEAVSRVCPAIKRRKHEGIMSPKKAIREALANHQRQIKIIIPSATDTDLLLFLSLVARGYVSFADPREQLVFEHAARHQDWLLGGRLLANILIEKDLPEHDSRHVFAGAHIGVKEITVTR